MCAGEEEEQKSGIEGADDEKEEESDELVLTRRALAVVQRRDLDLVKTMIAETEKKSTYTYTTSVRIGKSEHNL